MIGADTNVLLAALLPDDGSGQKRRSEAFLERESKGGGVFVSAVTVVEMVWVLRGKDYSRRQIVRVLENLIDAEGVILGSRPQISQAVEDYRAGKADFSDYLIMADLEAHGGAKLATFDETLLKDARRAIKPGS